MLNVFGAAHFRAVVAAVNLSIGFEAVSNDMAIAVMAFGR
jgi:hypothetical protein